MTIIPYLKSVNPHFKTNCFTYIPKFEHILCLNTKFRHGSLQHTHHANEYIYLPTQSLKTKNLIRRYRDKVEWDGCMVVDVL